MPKANPVRASSEGASPCRRFRPYLAPTPSRQHLQLLKRQQRAASNLTTCDHSTQSPRMCTFPYPIDPDGNPIPPSKLMSYAKTHTCPVPRCMCGLACNYFKVRTGEHTGKYAFKCGYRESECNFWVVPEYLLLATDGRLDFKEYTLSTNASIPPPNVLIPCSLESVSVVSSAGTSSPGKKSLEGSSPELIGIHRRASLEGSSPELIGIRRRKASPDVFTGPPYTQNNVQDSIKKVLRSNDSPLSPSEPQSPSSSYSSAAHGPLVNAKYTPSGYALPFPTTPAHYQRAYDLWSPPPVETVATHPPRHVTPPRGAFEVYHDLGLPSGIPAGEFWEMWEICRGCDHIVMGSKMKLHQCSIE